MFPIILTPQTTRLLLIGNGPLSDRRFAQLTAAGMPVTRFKSTPPTAEQISSAHIVYIADLPPAEAETLARQCRTLGTLVNVEDVIELCDFHTPAILQRGDLLFSISTNGKSPALARRIKRVLERIFDARWSEKLDSIASIRKEWQAQGLSMKDIADRTDHALTQNGWLPPETDT